MRPQILDEVNLAFPIMYLASTRGQLTLGRTDELMERNHRVLQHASPQTSNLTSVQNWTETTGSLGRSEVTFLGKIEDLLCTARQTDAFLVRLELPLETALISVTE